MNCLQAPQGNVKIFLLEDIAIAVNFFDPSDNAFEKATRSAQIHNENEAHSIFVPV